MRVRNIGGLQQVKAAAAAAVNNDNLCGKKKTSVSKDQTGKLLF